MKIERKDPLLSTLVNVEDGGEGVDTAIRKLDREFENVIEGANLIGDKVEELNTDVATLKGIDTSVFAKKEELINVVAGGGISIVQTGNEKKISSSIGNATSTESGLMSFIDKNLVDSWDDKRDSLTGHVGESEKHIPVGGITGQVLAKKSLDPYDVEWRNVGGATPAVYRVAEKTPDEFGNVDLEPSDIEAVSQTDFDSGMVGKADTNHTHPEAGEAQAGFMGIGDKKKLDELSELGITPIGNAGEALVVNGDGTGTEWAVVSGVPVGTIIAWGGLTAPAGYLECAGQIVKRTIYKDLFQAIGTVWGTTAGDDFKLPDFKSAARFLRSRGDGLEVGMMQEDAIRNIKGSLPHLASITTAADLTGVFRTGALDTPVTSTRYLNSSVGTYPSTVMDISLQVPTADENRPKNAVVMYCIKAVDEYINPSQVDIEPIIQQLVNKPNREEIKELAGTRPWVSGEYLPIANTPTIVSHGLSGIDPLKCRCDVLLICKVAEHGYSIGDQAISWGAYTGFGANPTTAHLSNTTIQYNTGDQQTGLYGCNKNTGITANFTLVNWRYIFRIWY